ncbi:helix-turn-helix domain-containing protein [Massilia norwichensis]|jgi:transcriptional regulator with XRE-family HTH domain|uniref:Helix-turn-helix domain-containing protein n=1 Tax=Massilia norwichensis TaxID=1442366 RepID=A0ABT2A5T5_9BURK|nr:helix-turn-helix domain-containing protein [Massilia norwichensis]MCS0589562.1 helix-turn-helix domain-containing protein [Massilia norwichensis]
MPKKLSRTETWPTLVQERLNIWGQSIRTQRLRQRITIDDLSTRLGISRTTLLRLEKGDPGAGAGAYVTAFLVLGIVDQAIPVLPVGLWQGEKGRRVRLRQEERGGDDGDYF